MEPFSLNSIELLDYQPNRYPFLMIDYVTWSRCNGRVAMCSCDNGRVEWWRDRTHYGVSGGPMMRMPHSKGLESSTRPAEKPSIGFLLRSGQHVHTRGG